MHGNLEVSTYIFYEFYHTYDAESKYLVLKGPQIPTAYILLPTILTIVGKI